LNELKVIDSQVKVKEQIMKLEQNFEHENVAGNEFDKRLALYQNLRTQLLKDLEKNKQLE